MPKPRDIREKALLYLFAHAAQKEDSLDDSTWVLTLEPEQQKINKIAAKALKHQLASLPQRTAEFCEIAPLLVPMLKTYEHKVEARTLRSLSPEIESLGEQYALPGNLAKEEKLHQFYHHAKAMHASLSEFKTTLDEVSFSSPELAKLTKVTNTLIDLTKRVYFITDPQDFPDQNSNAALIKATEEQKQLREKAAVYAQGTIDNLETINAALEEHLQNFSSDQIGRVERTLLRLSAYEIMVLKLPKGIVINESLELARKFTTEDAVPLINGVLDKLVA